MDRQWMILRLEEYSNYLDEISRLRNVYNKELKEKLFRLEPTVRKIMNTAEPGMGDYKRTATTTWSRIREQVQAAIGILADQEELRERTRPETPFLDSATMHPWVWEPAHTFWETGHHTEAVAAAWKSLNARVQAKVGRANISDDALMQEVLSETDPKPGKSKLRPPGERNGLTWKSRQRGMHQMAMGCASGIRNVVIHLHDLELSEQIALEYLAALSVLARGCGSSGSPARPVPGWA